jgi:hypothetical protein
MIQNQPAIPLDDSDMPLTPNFTIPITGRDAKRIQAIANAAGFDSHLSSGEARVSIRPSHLRRAQPRCFTSPKSVGIELRPVWASDHGPLSSARTQEESRT